MGDSVSGTAVRWRGPAGGGWAAVCRREPSEGTFKQNRVKGRSVVGTPLEGAEERAVWPKGSAKALGLGRA